MGIEKLSTSRILSVDIFRALTMLLMIFVNDLWTLTSYPSWLGHMAADYDGMGLADVVFPAFLFIVGLSIPFAIAARRKKGDNNATIFKHIVERTIALVLMGFFMVNFENIDGEKLIINKYFWEIAMALAFFLMWLNYRNIPGFSKSAEYVLRVFGAVILIVLSIIYTGYESTGFIQMKPHWWGILGLIGWAYSLNAIVLLFNGNKLTSAFIIWLIFLALNMQEFFSIGTLPTIKLVVSASNHLCVASGVLASLIYMNFKDQKSPRYFIFTMLGLGVLTIAFGFLTRPFWGISKIQATPSWTMICSGISYLSFALLYWISDVKQKVNWAKFIKSAGTSTLTCYIIPYFYYPILALTGWYLPEYLRTGPIGIIKSILFAILIIKITEILEKIHLRLKI